MSAPAVLLGAPDRTAHASLLTDTWRCPVCGFSYNVGILRGGRECYRHVDRSRPDCLGPARDGANGGKRVADSDTAEHR